VEENLAEEDEGKSPAAAFRRGVFSVPAVNFVRDGGGSFRANGRIGGPADRISLGG
jgi:hypothetical protein